MLQLHMHGSPPPRGGLSPNDGSPHPRGGGANTTQQEPEFSYKPTTRGGKFSRQVEFTVVNFAVSECITTRQSPQCVPLVCKKFAENSEFRVGNFAVNLKCEISHAKLKCHGNPPTPPL